MLPDDGFADREGSLLKYFSKIQASATFSVEYGLQANLMVVLEIEDETRVETFEVANDAQNMLVNRSSGFVPLALNALQWLLLFLLLQMMMMTHKGGGPSWIEPYFLPV